MSEIEVPRGWESTTLENTSRKITDGDHQTPPRLEKGIMMLSAKNILDRSIDFSNVVYVAKEDYEKSIKRCHPEKGDILLTCMGTLGRNAIIKEAKDFMITRSVALIKIKDIILPEYLSYYLNSKTVVNFIYNSKSGMAVKGLFIKDIKKIPIVYPNLPTQKKIIEKLDYILGQLEEKKKQIMQKMNEFDSQKIHKSYQNHLLKLAFSGALTDKNPEYVEKNQILVPKGWETGTIAELTVNFDNLRIPLNASQRNNIKGIYPYYGASGPIDSINNYKYDGKFLLIAEDGENLNTQKKPIAFIAEGKFWVNNHAHVVQTTEKLDIEYLCYYINSLNIMEYAKKQATRPKLKKSDLNKIPIGYPDLLIQKKIVYILDKKFTEWKKYMPKIENVEKQYQQTRKEIEAISSSILNSAFSGKLVN